VFPRMCEFTLFALCMAGLPAAGAGRVNLTVSAAVSLTESLQAIQTLYRQRAPNVAVTLNLGASGFLEQQIAQGAPVDVFISASPQEMNALETQGLLVNSTRKNLLNNTLVLIRPEGLHGVSGFADLENSAIKRVVIADPESVPAGAYARQVLEYFKLYRLIQPKLIFGGDVRLPFAHRLSRSRAQTMSARGGGGAVRSVSKRTGSKADV